MELENKHPAFYFSGNAFSRYKKRLFACVQTVSGFGHSVCHKITKMPAGTAFEHLAQLLKRCLRKK
jgi:hypothetical protein